MQNNETQIENHVINNIDEISNQMHLISKKFKLFCPDLVEKQNKFER